MCPAMMHLTNNVSEYLKCYVRFIKLKTADLIEFFTKTIVTIFCYKTCQRLFKTKKWF